MLLFSEPDTYSSLVSAQLKKGDAVAVARIAGIQAAKKTSDLIPLAHPSLAITGLNLSIEPFDSRGLPGKDILPTRDNHFFAYGGVYVQAKVDCEGKTGVEMEAMMAASVAGLTMYDMLKGVDKGMTLTEIRVLQKSGGKSGDWSYDYKTRRIVNAGGARKSNGELSTASDLSDVHGNKSTGPSSRRGTLKTHNNAREPQQKQKAQITTATRGVPEIESISQSNPSKENPQKDGNQNEPSINYSTAIHNINYSNITQNIQAKKEKPSPRNAKLTRHERHVQRHVRIRQQEIDRGVQVPAAKLSRMADINHLLASPDYIETSSLDSEKEKRVEHRVKRGRVTADDLQKARRRRSLKR